MPVSKDNQRTNLSSFLTAKADPSNYGKLEAFVMPQGLNVNGPVQVANSIQSDPAISQQFTLLSQGGSDIRRGQIQLIPVGTSIIYVQPIYVQQSTSQGYPQLRFVVVFTQGRNPVMAQTVNQGINLLFGLPTSTTPSTTTPGGGTTPSTTAPGGGTTPSTTAPAGNQTVATLLAQAQQKFNDAQTALTKGDLATYQADIRAAQDLVAQAQALLNQGAATSTSSTVPSAAFKGNK